MPEQLVFFEKDTQWHTTQSSERLVPSWFCLFPPSNVHVEAVGCRYLRGRVVQAHAPIDLMSHYQTRIGNVDVERYTALAVRGWITFWVPDELGGDPASGDQHRIGFGLRVGSEATRAQLNELTETERSDPYYPSNKAPWDGWMWRQSRPVVAGPTSGVEQWLTRFNVSSRNMRKVTMGESLYLFGGLNFAPASGGDISYQYDLTVACAKPRGVYGERTAGVLHPGRHPSPVGCRPVLFRSQPSLSRTT